MRKRPFIILLVVCFFGVIAGLAQTPTPTPSEREQVRIAAQSMYEKNLKTMQEYNCRTGMIQAERTNIVARLDGKPVPATAWDPLIGLATECIGTIHDSFSWYYRAKGYAEKGDTKAAFADLAKALEVVKTEQSPIIAEGEILVERADIYIKLGDRGKAEADLKAALALNPNFAAAKDRLAGLDQKMADARKASALANPTTAEDYLIVGTDAYQKGKYDNALLAFGKSLGLKPSAAAYLGKARALQALERPDQALPELNSALKLKPNDAEIIEQRGHVYRDLKRWDEAIADYTAALPNVDPQTKGHLLNSRGQAYAAITRYAEALKDHESALAAATDNVYIKIDAITGKGVVYEGQGKTDEALAAYTAAVAAAGGDYFAKLNLLPTYLYRGKLYAKLGKTEEAKADFNEIIKLAPKFSNDARAELAKLEGGAPTPAKTAEEWARDAQSAAMEKNYDAAITDYGECIKLTATNPACYAFRGAIYGLKGDMTHSDADFRQALTLAKDNPFIYFLHGQMYASIGKKAEAIEQFRIVLKLAPGNPKATEALQMLGEKP